MDYLSLQNCLLLYKTLAALQPVDHILINLVVKILAKKRGNYFKIWAILNLKLSQKQTEIPST